MQTAEQQKQTAEQQKQKAKAAKKIIAENTIYSKHAAEKDKEMTIKCTDFSNREKATFALRALYSNNGFSLYRMSKFEPFDFYGENRDYLDTGSIITFSDTDGKLMALKPDVTLSIVKNNRNIGNDIRRLYYNENVYRVSPRTHFFKEIMQVGLECLGQIDEECICQVIRLAAESLNTLSDSAKLDISNLDILSRLINSCGLSKEAEDRITECISEKNAHSLSRLCVENDIGPAKCRLLKTLITTYGRPEKVIPKLENAFADADGAEGYMESIELLKKIAADLDAEGMSDMINIDFSVVGDLKYYNGIIFKGFLEGVPDGVLSGGQYDKLMKNLKRNSKAIGFAVYLDELGRLSKLEGEEVIING